MNVSGINQYTPIQNNNNQTATATQAANFSQNLATSQAALATKTVTAQKGDTVWGFAQKYGSTVQQITDQNHLKDPNLILIGQKLKIPVSQTTTPTVAAQAYLTNQPTNANNPSAVQTDTKSSNSVVQPLSDAEEKARAYIVQHESGGNYNARNGKYIGKYQLDSSYLNGDYSPANQEKVAANYVAKRYGNWENAMKHWESHNWY